MYLSLPIKSFALSAAALLLLGGNSLFAQNRPSVEDDMNTDVDVNAARKAEDEILPGGRNNNNNNYDRRTTQRRVYRNNSNQNQQFQFDQPSDTDTHSGNSNRNNNNNNNNNQGNQQNYGNNQDNQQNYGNDRENPPAPPREEDYADQGGSRSDNPSGQSQNNRGQNDRRYSSQAGNRNQGNQQADIGAQLTTNDNDQLVIQKQYSQGFLANSNIQQGDVILSVNNQPVHSQQSFWRQVSTYNGRGPIPLVVLRNGNRQTIYVQANSGYASGYGAGYGNNDVPGEYAWGNQESAWLGVYLNARYQNSAVVQAVQQGSAADKAGLRPNDWIVSVNGQRIMSPEPLSQVIRDMDPGAEVNLEVSRRVMGQLQARLTDHPEYGPGNNNVGRETPPRPERPVNYEEQ